MFDKKKYMIEIADFLLLQDNCSVYWVDKEQRVLDFNNTQFEVIKNITKMNSYSEIVGKTMQEILSPETAAVVVEENNLVMKTKKAHQFLNVVKHKNYQTIIYLTIKTPLYDNDKNIAGIFGISQHISNYNDQSTITKCMSKREYECLTYLLQGNTSKEIADIMNLRKRTIEFYISNIKNKLCCETKSQLINKLYEVGLLTLEHKNSMISRNFNPGNFTPLIQSARQSDNKI